MAAAAATDPEKVVDDDLHPDERAVLGNGKSIEDRAAEGEGEEPEEDSGQFVIPGSGTGLTLNAGGRRPDVSEAKLAAIPLAIKGEFKKGDTLRLVVDVTCTGVHVKDEVKDAKIQRTRRTHHFTPTAVEPQEVPD